MKLGAKDVSKVSERVNQLKESEKMLNDFVIAAKKLL